MRKLPLEFFPLVALILLNLIIGAFTLQQYGESWDEFSFYFHGATALSAYPRLITDPGESVVFDPTHRFYGPAYTMLIVLISKLMPNAIVSDVAHAVNFVSFQVGLIFFYLLARRWLKPFGAFGGTILLSAQPLLWGHAFINPKDTIFMVGFIINVYLGLRMFDAIPETDDSPKEKTPLNPLLAQDWSVLSRNTKRRLFVLTALVLFLAVFLTLGLFWLRDAYFPPDFYDPHTEVFERYFYDVMTKVEKIGLFFILFIFGVSWVFLPHLPGVRKSISSEELAPFGRQIQQSLRVKVLVWAGLVLGLTSSMRFLALIAGGGIVALYCLMRRGRTALPYLVTYFSIAGLTMFLTWPYLWGAPIFRFLLTIVVMLHFPFPGQILFKGQFYVPETLPRTYLPQMIAFQLTETVIILSLVGFFILAVMIGQQIFRTKRLSLTDSATDMLYWVFIWFGVPVLGVVISNAFLYDNFRQFHFILPPLFLLSGFALDVLARKVKSLPIQIGLLGAVILPGVLGINRLLPYEYTYYNTLVKQPFREFELDYWGTSFREAAGFLNENVPQGGANLRVWGPITALWPYLRSDILIYPWEDTLPEGPYYALMLTRDNKDLELHPEIPPLFTVERDGAVFAVVKKIP